MQKIERFRYIDDSASSTTTSVTSPVESIERSQNLISNTIEQFDDYIRKEYPQDINDDINSLIDRLDSDTLINGSYSDLNILNRTSFSRARPQSFQQVEFILFSLCHSMSIDFLFSENIGLFIE